VKEEPEEPAETTVEPGPTIEPEATPEPLVPPRPPVGDSAEAIDALLAAGRSAEALAVCRRVAEHPGNRSLSRFLHQYGRCLLAEEEPRDAAVMFTRCVVLYPSSPAATMSLIETAAIYIELFENPESARRLLQRAADSAAAQERDDLVAQAREALDALDGKDAQ
jgi:predicted Zn-dependent protease